MYTKNDLHILFREIDSVNTAFFIGAGAASCSLMPERCQLPLGNDVKLELYKFRYGTKEKLTIDDYERKFREGLSKEGFEVPEYISPELVWDKCLASSGEDLTPYINLLKDLFSKDKYVSPNYKFLAWLHLLDDTNIKYIVTTNFDEKLDAAYRLLQDRGICPKTTVVTAADEKGFEKFKQDVRDLKVIYKLHGTLSQPFTIKSSVSDMEKGLSVNKYERLVDIFRSNRLVVFIGYSCNDDDIFKALMSISEKDFEVKIAWIKRGIPKKDSNIQKVLDAFDSSGRIWQVESNEFLNKLLFESHETTEKPYVDREEININVFNQYKKFMREISKRDIGEAIVVGEENEPIPDILYGTMTFPKELDNHIFKIINSFDMQRLRDIKQLSFAQYRYPCATHTRFVHSIGVAYLISKALENPNIKKHINTEGEIANTIYAGLVHDVGHGPLGHVIDKFYDRLEKKKKHEDFTTQLIEGALIDLNDVLKKILVNFEDLKSKVTFKSESGDEIRGYGERLYLMWLLTDYALDLDRIDFLMRDSIMTGRINRMKLPRRMQQTIYAENLCIKDELNKIINDYISRLSVGTLDELDEAYKDNFPNPETKILYISNRGVYKLEDLLDFLLRLYTEMYINVYYNPIVSSAEAMMAKALHIAYDTGDIDISTLYKFTDSEFYSYLENLENDLIREIVYAVKHRMLFKPIIEFDLNFKESISITEIERRTIEEFHLDEYEFKSLVVVHIPRKKHMGIKNLFIMKDGKIIPYPNIHTFEEKLSTIKGKMFVHPKNSLFKEKQKLIELMKKLGIKAEVVSKNAKGHPNKLKFY
jgi:HD superfamily phosphohydrolase